MKIQFKILLTSSLVTVFGFIAFVLFVPGHAFAIIENFEELPPSVSGAFFVNSGCWNEAGQRNEGGAQFPWLSPATKSDTETLVVDQGTDSVDLWLNSASAACNSNIDRNGVIINKENIVTKTTTVSYSAKEGSGNFIGSVNFVSLSSTMNYQCQNTYNLRWVKICGAGFFDRYPEHQDIKLSGLNNLAPGTHNITISAEQRMIHWLRQGNGTIFRCVGQTANGGIIIANGLDDPRCPTVTVSRTITVVIRAPITISSNTEEITCDTVSGWAFDGNNTNSSLNIHIYRYRQGSPIDFVSQLSSYNISANLPRPDVNTAYGIGGNHGFRWSVPNNSWYDGVPSTVVVYALGVDSNGNLNGINPEIGRKDIVCPPRGDISVSVNCTDLNTAEFTFTKSGTIADQTITSSIVVGGRSVNTKVPTTIYNSDFGAGNPAILTYQSDRVGLQSGQTYTMSVSVSPGGDNATNNSANCQSREKSTSPYFRVYGHDVVVGRKFKTSSSSDCSKNPASVKAFTSGNGATTVGAGSQFAVSATGTIEGFISASMHNTASGSSEVPKPNAGLSFMNSGNDPSKPLGNDNSAYLGCAPDYESYVNSDGGFNHNGNRTFPTSATIPTNKKLYVNGDLTISGNIEDNTTDWTSIEDIKPIIVIVKGNIDIEPGVTRLDGLYVALPKSDGTGGEINTCAPMGLACKDNTLTINGAFVAKKVKLNRLKGDVASAAQNETSDNTDNNIAEVFKFPTEFYLGLKFNVNQPSDPIANTKKYDTIVGLPPVL